MLNLVDNKKLLHTYQFYANRHNEIHYHLQITRPQYAHPVYCEWCERIWVFRRSCDDCHKLIFCCGNHEKMKWCTDCLLHSTNSYLKKSK